MDVQAKVRLEKARVDSENAADKAFLEKCVDDADGKISENDPRARARADFEAVRDKVFLTNKIDWVREPWTNDPKTLSTPAKVRVTGLRIQAIYGWTDTWWSVVLLEPHPEIPPNASLEVPGTSYHGDGRSEPHKLIPVPDDTILRIFGLTLDEHRCLDHLCEAWNTFVRLGAKCEHDNADFRRAIDEANRCIAIRVARRVNPEVWTQPGQTAPKGDLSSTNDKPTS